MNHLMKTLVLTAVMATTPAAIGQSAKPDVEPAVSAPALAVVSINVPEGTLGDYVNALRSAATPNLVNVVFQSHPDLRIEDIKLPFIDLRQVTVDTAMRVAVQSVGEELRLSGLKIEYDRVSGGPGEPVHVLALGGRLHDAAARDVVSAVPEAVEVFSVQGLIQPKPGDPSGLKLVMEPEVVLTAVKTTLELASREGDPDFQMKFHPDSAMLLVRAKPTQINAMRQLLDNMERGVAEKRMMARDAGLTDNVRTDLLASLERAEIVYRIKDGEVSRARQSLERLRKLEASASIAPGEVDEAEGELARLEGEAQMAAIEIKRFRTQLEGHSGSPDGGKRARQGKSVVLYDIPSEDAELAKQVMTAVRGLEQALADPKLLKVQDLSSGQKAHTIMVAAEPPFNAIVDDILRELAGAKQVQIRARPGQDTPPDEQAAGQASSPKKQDSGR